MAGDIFPAMPKSLQFLIDQGDKMELLLWGCNKELLQLCHWNSFINTSFNILAEYFPGILRDPASLVPERGRAGPNPGPGPSDPV